MFARTPYPPEEIVAEELRETRRKESLTGVEAVAARPSSNYAAVGDGNGLPGFSKRQVWNEDM